MVDSMVTSKGSSFVMKMTKGRVVGLAIVGVVLLACAGLLGHYSALLRLQDQTPQALYGDGESATTVDWDTVPCTGPDEECHLRLNSLVKPLHYDLYLFPNLTAGNFTGNVSILINVQQLTVGHIRLHSKYLTIHKTTLDSVSGVSNFSIHAYERTTEEYLVVKQSNGRPIPKGLYRLNISFSGSLTRDIIGFYRSTYKENGITKFVSSTKFQPTYARRAFPCFDEPGFKTTFALTLVKPSQLVAISNMPVEVEHPNWPNSGLTTVTFQTSVNMTTYLLALAMGELSYLERKTKRGVSVRIYTTTSQIKSAEYANNITADIIDYFEKYFGLPYPLPKLDVVGIPDFISGAMEHWGMISFRESNLLYQPGLGSAFNKQRIASVIAHELAHMWFGNLVTLKWWNDLWLNEGFASYMEYKGVNSVHPSWEIQAQFVREDVTPILWLDGHQSSHPIVQQVTNPNQITELFDQISYSKGAAVIRMLEWWLGASAFRQGVTNFLTKYAYSNAITSDLYEQLQGLHSTNPLAKAGGGSYNITFVMDTWTRQMGYPLVRVSRLDSGKWVLTQERYLENRHISTNNETSPYGYKWEIPVGLQWGVVPNGDRSPVKFHWIHTSMSELPIGTDYDLKWLKVNVGTYGFYRVHYGESLYPKIKTEMKASKANYSPEERCLILDDIFSLAQSDYIGYNTTLDFVTYLKTENHYIPWSCVHGHLSHIRRLLSTNDEATAGNYRSFVATLLEGAYHGLTWTDDESDNHLDRLLKPVLFGLACEFGHKPCLEKTKELFDQWLGSIANKSLLTITPNNNGTSSNKPNSNLTTSKIIIPAGVRDIVYKWGMTQSNETHWNRVLGVYLNETDPQERIRLIRALTSIKEEPTLRKLLQIAKNETVIRRQDFFTLLKLLCRNTIGNPLVWEFYQMEYQYLVDRFTLNDRYFGRIIVDITNDFTTNARLKEVEEFFEVKKEAGAGDRARQTALENIRNNIDWASKSLPSIKEWLKTFRNDSVPLRH